MFYINLTPELFIIQAWLNDVFITTLCSHSNYITYFLYCHSNFRVSCYRCKRMIHRGAFHLVQNRFYKALPHLLYPHVHRQDILFL